MRTILVSGGAGYIGSKLVTKLLDNKFDIIMDEYQVILKRK